MAKLLHNITAYEANTTDWANDETIYPKNALLFVIGSGGDAGKIKRGDGEKKFSQLDFLKTEPAE